VAGIIQGVDGEVLGELRDHFLEQIELRTQRMQQDEGGSRAALDVAEPLALDLHA
jgi:hypothetical protein